MFVELPDELDEALSLDGRSAQAAFYVALRQAAYKLQGQTNSLSLNPALAISATLEADDRLGKVGGIKQKLEAAWRRGLRYVIFARDCEADAWNAHEALHKEIGAELAPPHLLFCANVPELLTRLRDVEETATSIRRSEYDQCQFLQLFGHTSLPIATFYKVPQLLREVRREELPRAGEEEDEFRQRLRMMPMTQAEDRRRMIEVSVQQHSLTDLFSNFTKTLNLPPGVRAPQVPQMIVLGVPGSGKTTLTRYLAWASQQQLQATDSPVRLRDTNGAALIPARIALRVWEQKKCPPLAQFLAERYANELAGCGLTDAETRIAHWQRWLETGAVLLLVDGLDEIPAHSAEILSGMLRAMERCPFVITCRTLNYEGYQGYFSQRDIPIFRLTELSRAQQQEYIQQYPAQFPARFDRAELVRQLHESPQAAQMQPLAAIPLLLGIICLVVDDPQGVQLPVRRSELYDKAITKLLNRDREGRKHSTLDAQDKKQVLAVAALQLFVNADRELQFDKQNLRKALVKGLDDVAYDKTEVNELIEDLVEVSGLLRRAPCGVYEFLHLTLQEFLAAYALAEMIHHQGWEAELEVSGKLVSVRHCLNVKTWDANWLEVLPLLTGCLKKTAQIETLFQLILSGQRDDYYRHRLIVSAYCLIEINNRKVTKETSSQITDSVFWTLWDFIESSQYGWVKDPQRILLGLIQMGGELQLQTKSWDLPMGVKEFLAWALKQVKYQKEAMEFIRYYLREEAAFPEILQMLAKILRTGYRDTQVLAASVLKSIGARGGTPDILEALAKVIRSGHADVKKFAVYAVRSIGPGAAKNEILNALTSLLRFGTGQKAISAILT